MNWFKASEGLNFDFQLIVDLSLYLIFSVTRGLTLLTWKEPVEFVTAVIKGLERCCYNLQCNTV